MAESPLLFVQTVALLYRRKDGGTDPAEWPKDNSSTGDLSGQAYRLLHAAKRVPGTRDDGTIDKAKLKDWIVEVRALCKAHGREHIGDSTIGELLAKSPTGADGIWPSEVVRDVLEDVGTTKIAHGLMMGLYNSRGAHFRTPDGAEERGLAKKYREWAQRVAFKWPFTTRLLEEIAKGYDHDAEWHDTRDIIDRRVMD